MQTIFEGYAGGVRDEYDERIEILPRFQINQCKDHIKIHQSKYTKELLKKFNLEDYKNRAT